MATLKDAEKLLHPELREPVRAYVEAIIACREARAARKEATDEEKACTQRVTETKDSLENLARLAGDDAVRQLAWVMPLTEHLAEELGGAGQEEDPKEEQPANERAGQVDLGRIADDLRMLRDGALRAAEEKVKRVLSKVIKEVEAGLADRER